MNDEVYRTEVGNKIVELRLERGIKSSKIVADKLGFKEATYRRYETDTVPPAPKLAKIAEFFGVSVDYLMGREEKASQNDYAFEEAGSSAASLAVDNSSDYQAVENDLGKLDEREILLIKKFRAVSEADKLAIAKYASKKEDEDKD